MTENTPQVSASGQRLGRPVDWTPAQQPQPVTLEGRGAGHWH